MEVVGWSPSEEFQDSDMFTLPPQVGSWSGPEDGNSSLFAGPSSLSFPKSPSPHPEPAAVNQRRSKDSNHVPRPRNAFIIFRCEYSHNYLANGGSERASDTENKSLSKRAGEAWRNAGPETIRYFKDLAVKEAAIHRVNHPDYRFRPKRKKPAGRRRSPKRRAGSPHPKKSAGRSSSVSSTECNQLSKNDPLQIQTITVSTSVPTLSQPQPHPSRQPTPDFFHGYGSTSPASPCSPLSPVDDILYMPRPTIAASRSDSLLSYTTDDSQIYAYPKDPLAPFPDDFSLFGPTYTEPDSASTFNYPPLAAVASSLAGWDGNGQGQKESVDSLTPKPLLHQEPDFLNPFLSLSQADGTMDCMLPFGLDPLSVQSDMDAYRMGLKEYGITPAFTQ